MIEWNISGAWLAHRLDCTPTGIQSRCHGNCCKSKVFWPPVAQPQDDGGCHHLGPAGCTLSLEDKPVACHLYPLKPNKAGTLVQHARGRLGCCKPNVGLGPFLYDAHYDSFAHLFGDEQADMIRTNAMADPPRDTVVRVPPEVAAAFEAEEREAEANILPVPRSQRLALPAEVGEAS